MADEHTIKLTPELNAEDVIKSAKKLRTAIQDVFNELELKNFDSKLQDIKTKLEDTAKASLELEDSIKRLQNVKLPTADSVQVVQEVVEQQEKAVEVTQELVDEQEEAVEATQKLVEEEKKVVDEVQKVADQSIDLTPELNTNEVLETAQNLRGSIQEILNSTEGVELNSKFQSLQDRLENSLKASESLEESMKELYNVKVPTEEYVNLTQQQNEAAIKMQEVCDRAAEYYTVVSHWKDVKKHLDAQKEGYEKILEQLQGVEEGSNAWKILSETARKAEESISEGEARLREFESQHEETMNEFLNSYDEAEKQLIEVSLRLQELETTGEGFIPTEQTEAYQSLIEKQEQLNNKMRVYVLGWNEAVEKADEMKNKADMKAVNDEFSGMNKTVSDLTSTVSNLGSLIGGVRTSSINSIGQVIRGVTKLTRLTKADLVSALNVAKGAFMKLFAAISAHPIVAIIVAVIAAILALIKVLKKAIEETKEQVEQIANVLKDIGKKSLDKIGDFVKFLGTEFVSFYRNGLKLTIRGIEWLISKLMSLKGTITDGLKQMALLDDGVNKVNDMLSNLTSSLEYVKNSLATAFAPILEVIEPLLTRFLDLLGDVITMIGMFIAKLTGATSYKRAIRQQKDYAKSIKGVGSAAEEAQKKLASYDKLQVINQDKGSSGGGGGSGVSDMFEDVSLQDFELPDWLKNLYELGTTVGTKLRDTLNSIPWESVKKGAKKAAQGIADFINGMTSASGLGESIGRTLGEVVNTFTTFVNTLLTKVNFTQLGRQIKDMFKSFLTITDFTEVGKMFSNAVNAFADLIIGIFSESGLGKDLGQALTNWLTGALGGIQWENVKKAISSVFTEFADLLNTFITPENFSLVAESFGNLVNSLVSGLSDFVKGANWIQFGESIAAGINTLFQTINWGQAGETISNLALGLLDMLLTAVNEIKWDEVGNKLVEFLSNIDWKSISKKATEISQKLREGLETVWDALEESGVFGEIIDMIVDFLGEKANWETALKRIKNGVIRDVLWAKVKNFFSGLFKLDEAGEIFGDAGEFFKNIPDAIAEGDFLAVGEDILGGIFGGILGALDVVTGPFQAVFDWVVNGFKDIFGIHSPAKTTKFVGEGIVDGILSGFGLVDFTGSMSSWWDDNVAPWFSFKKWTGIAGNVYDALTSTADETSTDTTETYDGMKKDTIDIFDKLAEGIKSPINTMLGFIERMVNGIINGINGMIDKLNTVHFDIPDWAEKFVGGGSFGFNFSHLQTVTLPRLAQGAVIPPNKEFAAVLGDQRQGVNIETPLETMVQAFKQAMAESGGSRQPIVLQLNGRTVAQAVWDEEDKRYKQTGRYRTV